MTTLTVPQITELLQEGVAIISHAGLLNEEAQLHAVAVGTPGLATVAYGHVLEELFDQAHSGTYEFQTELARGTA